MRVLRWIMATIVGSAAFVVAGIALAAAGPTDVSGLSPFAACTVGGPGTNFVNSEVEPLRQRQPGEPEQHRRRLPAGPVVERRRSRARRIY